MYPDMIVSLTFALSSLLRSGSGTAQACCTLTASSNSSVNALIRSLGEASLAEEGAAVAVVGRLPDETFFEDSEVIKLEIIDQLKS